MAGRATALATGYGAFVELWTAANAQLAWWTRLSGILRAVGVPLFVGCVPYAVVGSRCSAIAGPSALSAGRHAAPDPAAAAWPTSCLTTDRRLKQIACRGQSNPPCRSISDLRYALRLLAPQPDFHRDGGAVAGGRHRGDRGDLQPRRRDAAPPAGRRRRSRDARRHRPHHERRRLRQLRLSPVPRDARASTLVSEHLPPSASGPK